MEMRGTLPAWVQRLVGLEVPGVERLGVELDSGQEGDERGPGGPQWGWRGFTVAWCLEDVEGDELGPEGRGGGH